MIPKNSAFDKSEVEELLQKYGGSSNHFNDVKICSNVLFGEQGIINKPIGSKLLAYTESNYSNKNEVHIQILYRNCRDKVKSAI